MATQETAPTCVGCNYTTATYFIDTPQGIARGTHTNHLPACDHCAELTLTKAHELATSWGRTTDPYEKWVLTVDQHSGAKFMGPLNTEVLAELRDLQGWDHKYPR